MLNSKNTRGNILPGLAGLLAVTVLAYLFGTLSLQQIKSNQVAIQSVNASISQGSAAEIGLLVLRSAERTYYKKLREFYKTGGSCHGTAQSFTRAFASGVQCKNVNGTLNRSPTVRIPLIDANDWSQLGSSVPSFIRYSGQNCTLVAANPANCLNKNGGQKLFSVGAESGEWESYFLGEHVFYIEKIDSKAGILIFKVVNTYRGKKTEYRLGYRWSAGNLAHIEVNGRITQENPSPMDVCAYDLRPNRKGKLLEPWGPLYVFDSNTAKCRTFTQVGAGKGIGFFKDYYLSLRSHDGQITVLNEMWNDSAPYLVDESGALIDRTKKVSNKNAGFEYSKEALVNADDFTIVDGHIYFVSGQGKSSRIKYLKKGECPDDYVGATDYTTKAGVKWCSLAVCELGQMGYGLRIRGISAPSFSSSLFNLQDGSLEGTGGVQRQATFFIKGSSGNMFRVFAQNNPGQVSGYTQCTVVMDREDQQVEYKRSGGFERVSFERPYFLY